MQTAFTEHVGIEVPLICGAMYPCSNPELIAAVSAAGGIGIVQPISMMFVHGHDLREGIQRIRRVTDKPIGFNALVEKSSDVYMDRMKKWVDVALEEGVRFFITALGNPRWVVDKVHALAEEKGCTPAQLALAWVLARGEHIVPIPGTRKLSRLEENIGATEVSLTDADLAAIDEIAPKGFAAGTRYPEQGMALVNG